MFQRERGSASHRTRNIGERKNTAEINYQWKPHAECRCKIITTLLAGKRPAPETRGAAAGIHGAGALTDQTCRNRDTS